MAPIHRFKQRRSRSRTRAPATSSSHLIWIAIIGAAVGLTQLPGNGGPVLSLPDIGSRTAPDASFALCSAIRRDNCVIDGDTFTYEQQRIRIADIDASETHPPRCALEADLGERATRRLQALLNDGPFMLGGIGSRDEDQYGRKLRIVMRDGRSVGSTLVAEGLARPWTGRRRPWCA